MIEIVEPGIQCTIQDLGRSHVEKGFAPAGALDSYACRMANVLVGNDPGNFTGEPGAACLEIVLFGTKLLFHDDYIVALGGADLQPSLDGQPVPMWSAFKAGKGQLLSFGTSRNGSCAYLAVAGGLDTPSVLGSRSTFLLGGMGGLDGKPLKKGDRLQVRPFDASVNERIGYRLAEDKIPVYDKLWNLHVVMGPQDELFTEESVALFLETEWTLTPVFNRMGYRFTGPKLSFRERPDYLSKYAGSDPSNIVDDPIPVGGIQVPSGEGLVLMHREGPTLGGYAKIATVISADLWKVAQMKPANKAKFIPIDVQGAFEKLQAQERLFQEELARAVH